MKLTAAQVAEHQRKHGFLTNPLEPLETLLLVSSPNRIDFFLAFDPPEATSQQKGVRIVTPHVGKPFATFFKKAHVLAAEEAIGRMLLPFAPKNPFEGPLRLETEWTWPWRTSEKKANTAAGWRWRDTQPDFDNISKMLVDQMAELHFFTNDSQIADARVMKQWGARPGIRIAIETLENP